MSLPLQVGITGGIGTGKSTVAKIFQCLGIPCYDADSRAKWLMSNDSEIIQQIQSLFGMEAYVQGQLQRTHIARLAFEKPEILDQLNAIVHPGVALDYQKWYSQQKTPYTLKEAALLFESGSYRALDRIIVVTAPHDIRLARLIKRDPHRSVQDIEKIMLNQWPEERKIAMASDVIDNGQQQMVIPQVLELDRLFKNLSQSV